MHVADLPRVVFVLGKGGVGRSTVSIALAKALADRGERVLVFEWAIPETVAVWFGHEPVGTEPCAVADGIWAANFRVDDALRAFFVGHLGMKRFYRHVIHGPAMRRLVDAAPGVAEMMFLGHVSWLTSLAAEEVGFRVDRVIVDAPATGHAGSVIELPASLALLRTSGLLAGELAKVDAMMADPRYTGALLVALPEELAVEETLELAPRVARALGRPPLGVFVNRSVSGVLSTVATPADVEDLLRAASPRVRAALALLHGDLRGRLRHERQLHDALVGATSFGLYDIDDQLALGVDGEPRTIALAVAKTVSDRVLEAP